MSRSLAPDWRQKEQLAALVDDLGIKVYREVKASLEIGRMKPFQRLDYTDVMRIIGMMESLKILPGEKPVSRSHQSHPSQPASLGSLERHPSAAAERSER